ncbi:hypothetical protein [Adhaeribacter rhizoryzae]|nr:hypothetical protein [Adhaeribacter rhizoryzae]
MKQNITSVTIAQDYQRGWEISQKEYLRQHKQEQRQKRNYTATWSSTSRK